MENEDAPPPEEIPKEEEIAEETPEKSLEKSTEKFTEKSADKFAEKSGDKFTEKSTDKFAKDSPGKYSKNKPVKPAGKNPAKSTGKTPAKSPAKPAEKKSPKNIISKKRNVSDKNNVVTMPPCGHAWCLGEVLREAGIEPGVCCPKPLPWGQPGRLKYLPGWGEPCQEYQCKPMRYGTVSKKRNKNEDIERRKMEAEEAKLLWSFLAPVFQFPKKLKYEDKEETRVCQCLAKCCKWDSSKKEELKEGEDLNDPDPQ